MRTLEMNEVQDVSGGVLSQTEAGLAIIGLAVGGGPFVCGMGLAIGFGLLFG